MGKINVAVIGVGSFTKALVEGVSFYAKHPTEETGLANPLIGNYRVEDINFVAAFDVDERKVGQPLSKAIELGANITKQITKPLDYDALVYRGPTLDGVIEQMKGTYVQESGEAPVDIADVLQKTKSQMVVNLVPSGSDEATKFYAQEALRASCSFINCIPTPLAVLPDWRKKFEEKGLVLLGDDTKSQIGATMLNRILLEFLSIRGVRITKSEQINEGGNADHYNLLYRSEHKEKSKSGTLAKFLKEGDAKPTVKFRFTGKPSGHKHVFLNIEGEIFGRTPIKISSIIEDEISINGAGTLIDAIRIAQWLVDTKQPQKSIDASPLVMKNPPVPMSDGEAFEAFSKLLTDDNRRASLKRNSFLTWLMGNFRS